TRRAPLRADPARDRRATRHPPGDAPRPVLADGQLRGPAAFAPDRRRPALVRRPVPAVAPLFCASLGGPRGDDRRHDAARRAGGGPSEPGEDPSLVGQILADPLSTIVRPSPLSTRAVGQLAREILSADADEDFCLACHEATGGNPLLVHELLKAIAGEGVEPT